MDENLNVGTQSERVEITVVQSSLYSGTIRGHKRGFAWTKIKPTAMVGPVSVSTTKAENGATPVHSGGDDRCPETEYHIFPIIYRK